MTLVIGALAVGVPIGIAAGRWIWIAFAGAGGFPAEPVVTAGAVGLVLLLWLGNSLNRLLPAVDFPFDLRGGVNLSTFGFTLLVALQFATAWIIVHKGSFRIVVNPPPALLVRNGQFQQDVMRHRVDEVDVRAAVRGKGFAGLEQVGAVVLEPMADSASSRISAAVKVS